MSDPIIKLLRKPNAPRIAPELDQFQVPMCDIGCPYFRTEKTWNEMIDTKRCKLTEREPDRICEPAVRVLIDMAERAAAYEHGERL
jgi:hypothetical protein